ncbi:MAG TPA: hypothetical protein VH599_14430 [Ktedonobacterales bacterium]
MERSSDAQAQGQDVSVVSTGPMPSLAPPAVSQTLPAAEAAPEPEARQSAQAGSGSASIFRIDQERLAVLQDLNWRRARVVLWALAVGVALGFLLLIPTVHQSLTSPPAIIARPLPAVSHQAVPQRPAWAGVALALGIGGPLLALALGLIALPALLWRATWLRRQNHLHLAIGRQGLLFFLPGQMGRWFLLPWGHIAAVTDVTVGPRTGRRARLRTVAWRRWARLRRMFVHGRGLSQSSEARPLVRSPFQARARAAGPRLRLRVTCYARLPDRGYSWLFSLAPFTRRQGSACFRLETGWFETAADRPDAASLPLSAGETAPRRRTPKPAQPAISLHRVLLGLWAASLLRAQRGLLPLPRSGGAVLLNTSAPAQGPEPGARRVDVAAWAALPLTPALIVAQVGITLFRRQPLAISGVLDLAALCVLTLGLGLLLAGIRWPKRGRLFVGGAFLLGLAGALNVAYGEIAFLRDWPHAFRAAPSAPFFFLEALAGLLLIVGGVALGLEGSGRPGVRAAAHQHVGAGPRARPHSAELVVALGLLGLGVARVLEDINLAALSSASAVALQWLGNTLAEPLLPLAIIGLSYFALLAGPALQKFFRALQAIYGLALGLLGPAAFIVAYRASGGVGLLPRAWAPLLALELICGLLVVVVSLRGKVAEGAEPGGGDGTS